MSRGFQEVKVPRLRDSGPLHKLADIKKKLLKVTSQECPVRTIEPSTGCPNVNQFHNQVHLFKASF